MVHSSCHVVGTLTSLFRRFYNRRRGYKPIPRCEAEEEKEKETEKAQDECKRSICEGCRMAALLKGEEEREGEGPERCGDRLMARCRGRDRSATSFAGWKDLQDASYMYTMAGSCTCRANYLAPLQYYPATNSRKQCIQSIDSNRRILLLQ